MSDRQKSKLAIGRDTRTDAGPVAGDLGFFAGARFGELRLTERRLLVAIRRSPIA
jgi:hypothetical protein